MTYNIYKLNTSVGNFQAGDDVISNNMPYQGNNGQLLLQGEIYGSGYLGQIAAIPTSMLVPVANNVDSSLLECYINYSQIPTPESNPNAANIGSCSCYSCSQSPMPVNAPATAPKTVKKTKSMMPELVAGVLIVGIIAFAVVEYRKAA